MKAVRFIIFAVLLIPAIAFSSKNGITGRTLKTTTNGCSCHNSTPATSVGVTITGPAALNPGATGSYTVTVTDAAGNSGGVDIAASAGTLAPVSTFLKLLNGELTQTTSVTVPSTYNFTFTAPSVLGTATLYATGKGTAFAAWNNAPNFNVNVTSATAVAHEGASAPTAFALDQNYPNPFNPSTQIRFSIAQDVQTRLAVYDMEGREVAVLVNSRMQPGVYAAQWDAKNLPTGVYFCRLTAGGFTETRKLLVQK